MNVEARMTKGVRVGGFVILAFGLRSSFGNSDFVIPRAVALRPNGGFLTADKTLI
jgi:hypothetical protein